MPPHERSGPEDLLARLEARLDRAAEAAEELIAQAAPPPWRPPRPEQAPYEPGGGATEPDGGSTEPREPEPDLRRPPPAGWHAGPEPRERGGDLELLMQVLGSLRERVPSELQRRLAEALRELLLALRALIDWYLERAERERRDPVEVQDIPIL